MKNWSKRGVEGGWEEREHEISSEGFPEFPDAPSNSDADIKLVDARPSELEALSFFFDESTRM